ncbi:alpha/beta hydrolase [Herbaspirillum lusitanum]|uniref:Alpha/beta hydrolase n=1 Tax=Herbaspirillum lusitanum TaxID=213312 RepID=A0ABW9ADL7_9BURK
MNTDLVKWQESNGIALRYALSGNSASGRTLVLLHEMGGGLESWDRVMPLLDGASYRILRFDMRGAGLSEKPRAPFSIDDLRDDLAALLAALGINTPLILAGCAVGAAVAVRFAACFPERSAGLLAMSPSTGIDESKRDALLAQADAIEAEGVRERIAARFDHSYPASCFPDASEREQLKNRLFSVDPYSYAATYRMLCRMDLNKDFSRVQCPTLILAGTRDTTRTPQMVKTVAAAIAGAAYREVDSGHVMPVHAPAAVADALAELQRMCEQA